MKGFDRVVCCAVCLSVGAAARAQDRPSANDTAFVGKVSQGGLYEVMASKVALQRATRADVKQLAAVEVHDHEQVNAELKKISDAKGVAIEPTPNAEFQARLAHLKAARGFDAAYVADMKQIHDKDEKLFAQEAMDGGASRYKSFAAKTDGIVKRHIGALAAL